MKRFFIWLWALIHRLFGNAQAADSAEGGSDLQENGGSTLDQPDGGDGTETEDNGGGAPGRSGDSNGAETGGDGNGAPDPADNPDGTETGADGDGGSAPGQSTDPDGSEAEEADGSGTPGDPEAEANAIAEWSDARWLAQIIHAEAAGEPEAGRIAVGNVVVNRAGDKRWPNAIRNVVLQKSQFTPLWKSDGTMNWGFFQRDATAQTPIAQRVLDGEKAVPDDYFYFSAGPATRYAKDFIKIGGHYFGRDINDTAAESFAAKDREMYLSQNFKLYEFFDPEKYIGTYGITRAMTEKIQTVVVRKKLLDLLEGLREMFRARYPGTVITLRDHGGYRPSSPVDLNGMVGGAKGSQHRLGAAADIHIKLADKTCLDAADACIQAERWMELNGIKGGIGIYHAGDDYFHVDVRGSWTAWYAQYSSAGTPVASAGGHTQGGRETLLKKGNRCAGIVLLQRMLGISVSGIFDEATETALMAYQTANGLAADGIYGPLTNAKAKLFDWGVKE